MDVPKIISFVILGILAGSLVGRSVLGDPVKILKVHQDVSRMQSREATTFDLDLQSQQMLSPSKAGRDTKRTSVSLLEHSSVPVSPTRKLVPISETEVQSRIFSLMEKEKRSVSKRVPTLLNSEQEQDRLRKLPLFMRLRETKGKRVCERFSQMSR